MALLVQLFSGLSCLAAIGAILVLALRVRDLEAKVAEAERKESQPNRLSRSGRPMLAGLQREESASPLAAISKVPGGWWVTGAAALTIAGMMTTRGVPAAPTVNVAARPVDSTVVQLRGQVDTLSLQLRTLRDSVQQASVAKRTTPVTVRKVSSARIAAAPAAELPPAPAAP